MKRAIAAGLLLVLAACGGSDSSAESEPAGAPAAPESVTTSPEDGGKIDGLTLRLVLDRNVLGPNDQTGATLLVQNDTDKPIVDPGCFVGAGEFGIVPADDPNADLEYSIVVDCAGPYTFKPGFGDKYESYTFRAATIEGEALPPGDYLASLQLQGYSKRVSAPTTVTD
jgi:hypothetical protein